MKLYKHTFDFYKNIVNTIEIEVVEKVKTYAVVEGQQYVWESRISKDSIGVLDRSWGRKMYTLTPDKTQYLEAMIADIENEMSGLHDRIEKGNELKSIYEDLLRKEKS